MIHPDFVFNLHFVEKFEDVAASLHVYGVWARSPERRKLAPEFVDGLSRGAQANWIPALNALDKGANHQTVSPWAYKELSEGWRVLSTSVGLNENKERKRYASERQRHCSYPLCEFNLKESEVTLLSCKGCGMARYCSKDCQREVRCFRLG